MKIQEVVQKTGLQKRTIYYYMDEKLIEPSVNEKNGYRDFCEEDVRRLIIIRKLRDTGLPISDIRAILRNPRTTSFYLTKQLNQLQTQYLAMEETIKTLDEFTNNLPVCQSTDQLCQQLSNVEFKADTSQYHVHFESRNARMIAQYLWQSYVDTPMTEYQQFLWQKIMQHTLEHTRTDLKVMAQFLQYLPPEQVDAASVNQYHRSQKIIALSKEDYPDFVEELKHSLLLFSSDPVQKAQWKLLYKEVIRPTTLFAFSATHWLLELHPDYLKYYENIHACCMLLKDYMYSPEGQGFKEILETAFDHNYDFEASSYGEFEIAAFFHKSVYSLLTPKEIDRFFACQPRY